jgi:hypothetical protein
MKRAASDARKTIVLAMSSASARNPTGTVLTIAASLSASTLRVGVLVGPGPMALTVIPKPATSRATSLVRPIKPALEEA